MRFQTKLTLTYSIFIIFLVIILGGLFYKYSTEAFEKNAYSNIEIIASKMSQQFENLINPMDFKTTELLSDESFVSSLTSLATIDRDDPKNQIYISEARQSIKQKLITYSIDKNFYRVSFFNNKGDFLTSNYRMQTNNEDFTFIINNLTWRKSADLAAGKMILIAPYADPWIEQGSKVFGVARSVQWPSSGMGYLEIQKSYFELKKIFSVPEDSNTKVVVVSNTREVFYDDGIKDKSLLKYYSSLYCDANKTADVKRNVVTGKDEIVVVANSQYTGVSIIIAQDKAALFKPLLFTAKATIMIGIAIVIISLIYIFIFTQRMVKPIRILKENMENTELQNLRSEIKLESSHNEVEALNNSFQRLKERLNEAVRREIKSQSLQMRANFDSLQAQVNPHFIFNILNVLSNKGIENGDEEICEICNSIAAMLRYSTSTKERSATIGDELEHVKNYLLLMKKRYEHRLEFDFHIDETICSEFIPKIVLQQIVENSVNHGFENGKKIVKINIRGYISEGWWYIEFTDNGGGFEPNVLKKLENRMKSMRWEIINGKSNPGLAIGGMGLINTLGRLALFYNDKFVFTLKNIDEGVLVTIGAIVGISEEDMK